MDLVQFRQVNLKKLDKAKEVWLSDLKVWEVVFNSKSITSESFS